jgi:DNA (cytosine-5)-methyltransferase 1
MIHLDLFSGIGGFALAASWVWPDHEPVGFCEIDPFCQKVLNKHWPGVPIYDDIKKLKGSDFGTVDLLTAGYPCQPFSTAKRGVQGNTEDFSERVVEIIRECKPRISTLENVSEHAQKSIAKRLRDNGFGAFCRRYSAHQIGAWHKRNRWFVIAHPNDKGEFQSRFDAKMAELQGMENRFWSCANYARTIRMDDGLSRGMDRTARLKALGNAIVPRVAEQIFKAIKQVDI